MSRSVRYGNGRYVTNPIDWAKCGSEAGAAQHRRRGERPCPACLQAETRAKRERVTA